MAPAFLKLEMEEMEYDMCMVPVVFSLNIRALTQNFLNFKYQAIKAFLEIGLEIPQL